MQTPHTNTAYILYGAGTQAHATAPVSLRRRGHPPERLVQAERPREPARKGADGAPAALPGGVEGAQGRPLVVEEARQDSADVAGD